MMVRSRASILASARALYLEGGAKALTMRSLAERVGVTATALYRHFDGKDDLLGELLREAFDTFGAYLHRALNDRAPLERLQSGLLAYLDFALEQREIYRMIFMNPVPLERRRVAQAQSRDPRAIFRFLVDRLRECADAGDLQVDDPEQVAAIVWAQVHGLVSLQIAGALRQTDESVRETYRRSITRLVAGLSKAASG